MTARVSFISRRAQYDEAIANYDTALRKLGYEEGGKVTRELAHHLYGRGLARRKKGDVLGGTVDITQAKTARPELVEDYESYFKQ